MISQKEFSLLALLGGVVIILSQTAFIVNEAEQALVLQFGKLKRTITQPGLNFKIPFIEDTIYIDKRVLNVRANDAEVIAVDEKRFVVDTFARYKIVDPIKFYRTVRTRAQGDNQINTFLNASVRRVLGQETLMDVLSEKRDDFMQRIEDDVSKDAKKFGIEMVDVRIQRADLPQKNSTAIYQRMIANYDKQARTIRSEGQAEKSRIESDARKRQASEIVAVAQREADIIKGQGDAERNLIFARVYQQDPEFFGFYRSMQAYENVFSTSGETQFVLSPTSPFLDYLTKN